MKLKRATKFQLVDGVQVNSALQAELNTLKNAPPKKEVIEIEKIVEKIIYQDDPGLLNKYNAAMRELGKLKSITPQDRIQYVDKIVEKIVPAQEVVRTITKQSYAATFIAALIALLMGLGIGYWGRDSTDVLPTTKNSELRNTSDNVKRTSTGRK